MKSWIRTSCYWDGTTEANLPDLGNYETDREIRYSLAKIDFPTDVLCRVAGPIAKVSAIVATKGTLTDAEARTIIKRYNPNADLENVDVRDPEIDGILESLGENPQAIRKQVQTPTVGRQVLQDQELNAMKVITRRKGVDISPYEDAIKRGKQAEHEDAMAKLR